MPSPRSRGRSTSTSTSTTPPCRRTPSRRRGPWRAPGRRRARMASGVVFWGRVGAQETGDALAFLRHNRYAADKVLDLTRQGPKGDDLDRLAKGLGAWWPLV